VVREEVQLIKCFWFSSLACAGDTAFLSLVALPAGAGCLTARRLSLPLSPALGKAEKKRGRTQETYKTLACTESKSER